MIGFLLIAFWIYCIFDVIATDEVLVRSLPKLVWLFIVVVLPTIGSIAWLALGRPVFAGWRPGDTVVVRPAAWWGPRTGPTSRGGRPPSRNACERGRRTSSAASRSCARTSRRTRRR